MTNARAPGRSNLFAVRDENISHLENELVGGETKVVG
jgi:hypothetical protein